MQALFEWDEDKARDNLRKQKVSFEEAQTVFYDPLSITIPDPDHSFGEDRFIDIGLSAKNRILVVVYTEPGNIIRLMSARKATPRERMKL